MSPPAPRPCPRCHQVNLPSDPVCANCGAKLSASIDADERRSDAGPSSARPNSSAQNPSGRNVIVTDQSHSAIAIGNGARATKNEITARKFHKTEIHISPGHSRLTVLPDQTYHNELYPGTREELELPVTIGDDAVAERFVFSATSLHVGADAILKGPVYGADAVILAEGCQLGGPIIGSNHVLVGDGCKPLAAEQHVDRSHRLIGILAVHDVDIGHDVQLDYVVAGGDVRIGTRCTIGEVRAKGVVVGDSGQVDRIVSAGDLALGSQVTVGQFEIGGRLSLGDGCHFKDMNTIILVGPSSGSPPTVMLGGRQVGLEAMFVSDGRDLLPFTGDSLPASAALVVTNVMNHRIWRALKKLTGASPSMG